MREKRKGRGGEEGRERERGDGKCLVKLLSNLQCQWFLYTTTQFNINVHQSAMYTYIHIATSKSGNSTLSLCLHDSLSEHQVNTLFN